AGKKRVGDHHRAAMGAGCTQVVKSLEVAALALPVADGVVNEIKLRDTAEVRNGEYRYENRLQPRIIALVGQFVHLQKTLVGAPLHFDQVGNLGGCRNLGKIEPAANRALLVRHASLLSLSSRRRTRWCPGSRRAGSRVSRRRQFT